MPGLRPCCCNCWCQPWAAPYRLIVQASDTVFTDVQSLLWDVVASSVPWDVQPPAEGKLSAHETLAKTLLLLLMSAPGIPTLPQDVTEDGRHRDALAQCLAFRKAYAAQLLPSSFLPAREVHWHGATPGDAHA